MIMRLRREALPGTKRTLRTRNEMCISEHTNEKTKKKIEAFNAETLKDELTRFARSAHPWK